MNKNKNHFFGIGMVNSLYQIELFVPHKKYDEIYEKMISSCVCLEDTK